MPIFNDVVAHAHKGLRHAALLELSKVNVLCGANNSGKTTVLECLAKPNLNSLGVRPNEDTYAHIENTYISNFSWSYHTYKQVFLNALGNAMPVNQCIFEHEVDKVADSIRQYFVKQTGSDLQRSGALINILKSLFGAKPSVVLVSAKRRLDTKTSVASGEEIHPDGRGILNFLFAAKNTPQDSPEEKSFTAISQAFQVITSGYDFDVFMIKGNALELKFRKENGPWLQADDCGLGFRDLLIMLYFSLASSNDVVLIEEPENHLHPDIQRRMAMYIKEKSDKQLFLTTHSSVFLNTLYADRVFSCRLEDTVKVENATGRAAQLTSLGYSIADNLVSDVVILCEGPTDKIVLEILLSKMELSNKYLIKIWPLGGDIMSQLDLTVFSQSYRICALIDLDTKSSKIRNDFSSNCANLNIPVHRLERYSIENYLKLSSISKVMKIQIPAGIDKLKPKVRVSDQLGFDVKRNIGNIVKDMTLADIEETDLYKFLTSIQKMLTKG